MKHPVIALGLAAVMASLSFSSQAALSWSFRYDDVPGVGWGGSASGAMIDGDSTPYTYAAEEDINQTATVSGWAAPKNPYGAVSDHNDALFHWQGIGLDRDNDGHVIDNGGWDEFLIFEFNEPVSISDYSFGFVHENHDWDSTVLAFSPDDLDATYLSPAGNTIANMTSAGWEAIGHYGAPPFEGEPLEATVDISTQTQGGSEVIYSSYWAIGAFMDTVSADTFGSVGTSVWDGFKLSGLSVLTQPDTPNTEVPAPATLLLLALGWMFMRRYQGTEQQEHKGKGYKLSWIAA